MRIYENKPLIFAHRGLTSNYLENTICSLNSALEFGADGIEFDVQLSSDLEPYIFHDRNLLRLCETNAHIDMLNSKDIDGIKQKLKNSSKNYPISRLGTVLEKLLKNKFLNIELKETTGFFGLAGIKKILSVLKPYKNKFEIIISSFDPNILEMVTQIDKNLPLGLLMGQFYTQAKFIKTKNFNINIKTLHPHISLIKNEKNAWIGDSHKKIIIWGHKKIGEEKNLIVKNLMGIITDQTEYLVKKFHS